MKFLHTTAAGAVVLAALFFFGQAQEVTVNCEKGKPVAELQADGKVKIRCVTPTPEPPPTQPPPTNARDWFAKPDGAGDCTVNKPCSLATAISDKSPVRPGDTLWLRGGGYKGPLIAKLAGAEGKPVTVRQYPGERATIDGNLRIEGAWTVWRDFEVTNSSPNRTKTRDTGIDVFGPNVKLINLDIHDCGNGIGAWSPAVNLEVYGCLLYRNGWEGPDDTRGHGHGFYGQNEQGKKVIEDNISFDNYATGMKAFGEKGPVKGFEFIGNVIFNSGSPARPREAYDRIQNLIIGAAVQRAGGIVVDSNILWHPADKRGQVAFFGYSSEGNDDIEITNNYILGNGVLVASLTRWQQVLFSGNTVRGGRELLSFIFPKGVFFVDGTTLANNTYIVPDDRFAFTAHSDAGFSGFANFTRWQAMTTHEKGSAVLPSPKGVQVIVRPNKYQPGRAHVVALNWTGAASAEIDLAGVKSSGQVYEIIDVRSGKPVASGKYDGPVKLPLAAELGVWVVR
jgi:hypothetical protein